jgi:hypothetical protein
MTERERQTEFLVRLLVLAEPKAERDLQARIQQVQHDEKCVRFALTLVALIGGFAIAGIGYCAVLHPEFFDSTMPTLIKVFCAIGLGSLLCMFVFVCCWLWYRGTSNRVYEECRQLVMHVIQNRLKSQPAPIVVQTLDFSLPVTSETEIRRRARP